MQPLLQTRTQRSGAVQRAPNRRCFTSALSALAISVLLTACGGGGGGGLSTHPPPSQITVTISPASGSVLLGEALSFSATVSNSSNTSVSWSVNGIPGGSAQAGVISADGLYNAPADLPQGAKVQVTATSQADPTKSSTASVSITSDISVSISPTIVSIELGAPQSFHAALTSSGKTDPTIHWSLSGAACPGSCGTVDAKGNYTAPAILPSNPNITLIATSAADPSKQASTSLTITSHFTLQITAPSTLQPDASSSITATLTPVPGSAPSSVLSWCFPARVAAAVPAASSP
jgi:trimeric autotransporter adhesin